MVSIIFAQFYNAFTNNKKIKQVITGLLLSLCFLVFVLVAPHANAQSQNEVQTTAISHPDLIGGDVCDYRNVDNDNATNFIQNIYLGTVNGIACSSVSAKYIDLDDDNVPDLPIARLAVRTTVQLTSEALIIC